MQNTLLALACALIAAVISAAVGPYFVDWNGQRPLIEREASRMFGAPVRVGGALSIRLLPVARVTAEKVEVGQPRAGARIERLEAELLLAPLLRGRVEFAELRLTRPTLTLSGTTNPAFLGPIEVLTIEDGRLLIASGEEPPALVAEGIRLAGDSHGLAGPLRLEGGVRFAGRERLIRLSAGIAERGGLALRLRADDRVGGLAVEIDAHAPAEGPPRLEGQAILSGGQTNMPWRIAGPASITPAALVMERAEASLGPADRQVRASLTLRLGLDEGPGFEALASAHQVDLDRLAALDGSAGPRATLDALARLVPQIASPSLPGALGLDISGLTLGGAPLSDLRADLVARADGWDAREALARAPGDTQLAFKGRFTIGREQAISGDIAIEAARPAQLVAWLDGLPAPTDAVQDPIRARARVTADETRLAVEALDLDAAVGRVRGGLVMERPALGRNTLALDLSGERVDLDWVARLARGFGARLDRETDTRVTVRAAEARLADLSARDVDILLVGDGHRIIAERVKITEFAGAHLALAGTLDGDNLDAPGEIRGQVTLNDPVAFARLLGRFDATREAGAWLAVRADAIGTADMTIRLARQGERFDLVAEGVHGGGTAHVTATLGPGEARAAAVVGARHPAALLRLIGGTWPGALGETPTRLEVVGENLASDTPSGRWLIETADFRVEGDARLGPAGIVATIAAHGADAAPIVAAMGLPVELVGSLPVDMAARFTGEVGGWQLDDISGWIGETRAGGRLVLRDDRLAGELALSRTSAEALAALILGPAFLVETVGAGLAEAPFGRAPLVAFVTDLSIVVDRLDLALGTGLDRARFRLVGPPDKRRVEAISGNLFGGSLSGDLSIDRAGALAAPSGRIALDGLPASGFLVGATGMARATIVFTSEGASPAALASSLAGEGEIRFDEVSLSGLSPVGPANAARLGERAIDLGRPMPVKAQREALATALAAPTTLAPFAAALVLRGPRITMTGPSIDFAAGRIAPSAQIDLSTGERRRAIAVTPAWPRDGDGPPPFSHEIVGEESRLDVEDVTGWLALRLLDREQTRIDMRESDRLERRRQQTTTRLTAMPASPPAIVETPAHPAAPAPAEPAIAPVEAPGSTPIEPPHHPAQTPARQQQQSPAAPRAATPPNASAVDLPSVVRRALDGPRSPASAEPMSILPPLPPAIEVAPPPGFRR